MRYRTASTLLGALHSSCITINSFPIKSSNSLSILLQLVLYRVLLASLNTTRNHNPSPIRVEEQASLIRVETMRHLRGLRNKGNKRKGKMRHDKKESTRKKICGSSSVHFSFLLWELRECDAFFSWQVFLRVLRFCKSQRICKQLFLLRVSSRQSLPQTFQLIAYRVAFE